MKLRLQSIASIVFILTFASNLRADLQNDLVGYWPLNETSGNIAHDASGVGQNGTLGNYAGNQGNWVSGQTGGALHFTASSSQYVMVPGFTQPTSTMTLTAWVSADSMPLWATIAASWGGGYGLFTWGNTQRSGLISDYFAQPTSTPGLINVNEVQENVYRPRSFPSPSRGPTVSSLSLNTWHFMALVADGSYMTLYRDGQVSGYFGYTGNFLPSPVPYLTIGANINNGPGNGYWDGSIEDVGLWTRPLSADELGSIYQNGEAGIPLLPVPEPSSLCLLAVGLGVLATRKLR